MTKQLETIKTLTESYARFSRTHAGLGYLVAVILLPILYIVGRNLPLDITGSILASLVSITSISLWLWLRQQITQHLYQGLGVAKASKPIFDISFVLGICVGGIGGTALVLLLRSSGIAAIPETIVLSLPAMIIALVIGFFDAKERGWNLAFATALFGACIAGGMNFNALNTTEFQRNIQLVVIVIVPVAILRVGILEHLGFQKLKQQFKELSQGTP